MNVKTLAAALVVALLAASPAMAASFSFNKASAADMIAAAKPEGVNLPQAVADAIVKYRADKGPFKSADDVAKVPGMTPELLKQLSPAAAGGDVVFQSSAPAEEEADEPMMKAY